LETRQSFRKNYAVKLNTNKKNICVLSLVKADRCERFPIT